MSIDLGGLQKQLNAARSLMTAADRTLSSKQRAVDRARIEMAKAYKDKQVAQESLDKATRAMLDGARSVAQG